VGWALNSDKLLRLETGLGSEKNLHGIRAANELRRGIYQQTETKILLRERGTSPSRDLDLYFSCEGQWPLV
jgi:hypothetical protein